MTEIERVELLRQIRKANTLLKWYLRIIVFIACFVILIPFVVSILEPFDDVSSNVIVTVLMAMTLTPLVYWIVFSPFESYANAIQSLLNAQPAAEDSPLDDTAPR